MQHAQIDQRHLVNDAIKLEPKDTPTKARPPAPQAVTAHKSDTKTSYKDIHAKEQKPPTDQNLVIEHQNTQQIAHYDQTKELSIPQQSRLDPLTPIPKPKKTLNDNQAIDS